MVLKKNELEKYRKRLEELRGQLTNTLRGSTADVKTRDDSTSYSQHQADKGTDDFEKTISIEVTSKEYDILRNIDRALEKMDEGTYGTCDISGEEISIARLDAVPYANMTVKSQERLEKGLL